MSDAVHNLFNSLDEFIANRFTIWERHREPIARKWRQNLNDYHPYEEPFHKWKKAEAAESVKSSTRINIAKNKAVTAKNIITDTLFRGGRVQFALMPDDDGRGIGVIPSEPEQDAGQDPELQANVRGRRDAVNTDEVLIHRQLDLCDGVEELGRDVLSGAVYGICFAKRYVREHRHRVAAEMAPGVLGVIDVRETHPAIEYKSPWRMYWDIESGKSIRDGGGVMEVQPMSLWGLAELAQDEEYDKAAIERVLSNRLNQSTARGEETAHRENDDPRKAAIRDAEQNVNVIEFWGRAPTHLIEAFERKKNGKKDEPETIEASPEITDVEGVKKYAMTECMCVMIDGGSGAREIIRYQRTDIFDRPFYSCVWEDLPDDTASIGVVDNVHQLQTVITGSVQAMEQNAKATANSTGFFKPELLADKTLDTVQTGKWHALSEDCKDARQAVQQVTYNDVSGALREVISLFIGFADVFSHVPKAEQGQQENTAQTAFELSQRLERAGKYLGDVIRNYDRMIEDIIRDFYFFNLLDPEHATVKRYRVKALGFSSFENKTDRVQRIFALLDRALKDEELKGLTRLRYLWEEIIKATDLDPFEVMPSAEEMRDEAASRQEMLNAHPPQDPMMQAKEEAAIRNLVAAANDREAGAELKRAKAIEATRKSVREDAKAVAELNPPAAVSPGTVPPAMIPDVAPAAAPMAAPEPVPMNV